MSLHGTISNRLSIHQRINIKSHDHYSNGDRFASIGGVAHYFHDSISYRNGKQPFFTQTTLSKKHSFYLKF